MFYENPILLGSKLAGRYFDKNVKRFQVVPQKFCVF